MTKKRIAIIGCGRIGQRHAAQIASVGILKAVCDIVPEKADKLSAANGCNAYYSIEKLLDTEKVEEIQKGKNCEIDVKLFTTNDKKDIYFSRTSPIKYLK